MKQVLNISHEARRISLYISQLYVFDEAPTSRKAWPLRRRCLARELRPIPRPSLARPSEAGSYDDDTMCCDLIIARFLYGNYSYCTRMTRVWYSYGTCLTFVGLLAPGTRKRGWYGWKPSSSSNLSIRVFRAYPLIESSQTAPCRAIRGDGISANSTLPPLLTVHLLRRRRGRRGRGRRAGAARCHGRCCWRGTGRTRAGWGERLLLTVVLFKHKCFPRGQRSLLFVVFYH